MFNSKQGAAGKGGDETIWLEKDVLGPLAGTNTAFLYQVIFHGLYKCEKVNLSTFNLIVFRQATGGVKLRLQAAQSMPTAIILHSTGFTFYTIQHSTLTIKQTTGPDQTCQRGGRQRRSDHSWRCFHPQLGHCPSLRCSWTQC